MGMAEIVVGSLMYSFDKKTMSRVLRVPSEKMRDKVAQALHDYVTTMRRELGHLPDREATWNELVRVVAPEEADDALAAIIASAALLNYLAISGKALEPADGYWFIFFTHNTKLLTLVFLGADSAAHRRQAVALFKLARGASKIAICNTADECRDFNFHRAAFAAFGFFALQTALRLGVVNDQRLARNTRGPVLHLRERMPDIFFIQFFEAGCP